MAMNKKRIIKYVVGDATTPEGEGKRIICHVCNDIGAWGAGFVLALSSKWNVPEQFYRATQKHVLGDAKVLKVEDDIWVANMVAQHGIKSDANNIPPIRYLALTEALYKVNTIAIEMGATLHMPRIGCGLAGGEWEAVEAVIMKTTTVDVTIYDLA